MLVAEPRQSLYRHRSVLEGKPFEGFLWGRQ